MNTEGERKFTAARRPLLHASGSTGHNSRRQHIGSTSAARRQHGRGWVPRKGDEPFARGTLLHRADSCPCSSRAARRSTCARGHLPGKPREHGAGRLLRIDPPVEATLLANFGAPRPNAIYTFTGSILLALNPFAELPLYGESKMTRFKGTALGAEPPHAYAMAEAAYAALLRRGTSQSLVVSGESGAGKTETNKHLTRYLSYRSRGGSDTMNDLSASLLRAGPVLEAMGNAKTVRNHNSSRFGRFVKLEFDAAGSVVGARTLQYLLEKSRVVGFAPAERNFHVLYQLARGGAEAGGADAFTALNPRGDGAEVLPGVDDAADLAETRAALRSFVGEAEERDALAALGGLLHLANVRYDGDTRRRSRTPRARRSRWRRNASASPTSSAAC